MSQLSIYMPAVVPAARRLTAVTTVLALVSGTLGGGIWGYVPARAQVEQPSQAVQVGPQLEAAQIDQLVAPIALHPDNLLGQILSASTYPLEIVMAARWSAANPRVKGQQLEDAMQTQAWDPSVKSLAAVPQVLKMMSDKLEWTQQLGEAYLSQPDDIAASVQRLRARADGNGNLKNSEQVRVRRLPAERQVEGIGPEYIVIESTYPEVVYVPVYDPFVVYGAWAYPAYPPFYWYPPGYVALGVYGFGAGIFVGTALWATYNWNYGRVYINAGMYSRFNKVSISQANALAAAPVKFDPGHRGNVRFNSPALNTQFNKTALGNNPTTFSKTTSTGTTRNFLSNAGSNTQSGIGSTTGGTTGTKFTNKNVINNNLTNNQNKVLRSTSSSSAIGNATGNTVRTLSNNNTGKTLSTNSISSARTFSPSIGGGTGGMRNPPMAQNRGPQKKH